MPSPNPSAEKTSVKGAVNPVQELLASLVVFLVALPLCMGIAIASGAPPVMGLVSGIVGGIIVGLLAGAPLQVSGPAAGLAVLVYEAIQTHGVGKLWAIVLIAGILQIVAAKLSVGRWFRAVAPPVIYAMLAGIGVLIFASQFHVMVDDAPPGSGLQNLITIPQAIWKGVTPIDGSPHHLAAATGLLTLVALIVWGAVQKRMSGIIKSVPAPLVAVVVGTAFAQLMGFDIDYVKLPESMSELFRLPGSDSLSALWTPAILGSAVAFAAIASAESLLCAAAVDRLHDGDKSDLNKELFAQGVGNAVCGVIGGLPITGVIVRSTANIEAGAKTRWSAVLHGIWLLGLIAFAPQILQLIPVSGLAAILVFIGYRLVDKKVIKMLWNRGRAEFGVYLITVVSITATDLLTGLGIGIALTLIRLVWHFSHLEAHISKTADGCIEVDLLGAATFMSLPKLTEALENLPEDAAVRLHLDHLQYCDHACLEFIGDWERRRLESAGGTLKIAWDDLEERVRSVRMRSVSDNAPSSPPKPTAPNAA